MGSIEAADATEPRMLAPHTRHDAAAARAVSVPATYLTHVVPHVSSAWYARESRTLAPHTRHDAVARV